MKIIVRKPLPSLNELVRVGDNVIVYKSVLTERGQDSRIIKTPLRVTKVNRVTFDGVLENGDIARVSRYENWDVV